MDFERRKLHIRRLEVKLRVVHQHRNKIHGMKEA